VSQRELERNTLDVVLALPADLCRDTCNTYDMHRVTQYLPIVGIRIHWFRIGSQVFFWIRIQPVVNSGPNPDQDSDQDLIWHNVLEDYFDQKPSYFFFLNPCKWHSDSSHMKFINFLLFMGASFGLPGSGFGPGSGDPNESGSKTLR
jgi:hypothetical protein